MFGNRAEQIAKSPPPEHRMCRGATLIGASRPANEETRTPLGGCSRLGLFKQLRGAADTVDLNRGAVPNHITEAVVVSLFFFRDHKQPPTVTVHVPAFGAGLMCCLLGGNCSGEWTTLKKSF